MSNEFVASLENRYVLHRAWLVLPLALAAFIFWLGIRYYAIKPLEGPPSHSVLMQRCISRETKVHLLDGDFKIIRNVNDLPEQVKTFMKERGPDGFVMADPSGPFNPSDVIDSRPRQRLIFGGLSDSSVFLHYERGGIAHFYVVDFYNLSPSGGIQPVYTASCFTRAKTVQELRSRLLSTDCSDDCN